MSSTVRVKGRRGTDGLTLTAELRANPLWAKVPVVALTAYAEREVVQRCLAAGFDAHLTKPPDPAKIEALLASP